MLASTDPLLQSSIRGRSSAAAAAGPPPRTNPPVVLDRNACAGAITAAFVAVQVASRGVTSDLAAPSCLSAATVRGTHAGVTSSAACVAAERSRVTYQMYSTSLQQLSTEVFNRLFDRSALGTVDHGTACSRGQVCAQSALFDSFCGPACGGAAWHRGARPGGRRAHPAPTPSSQHLAAARHRAAVP